MNDLFLEYQQQFLFYYHLLIVLLSYSHLLFRREKTHYVAAYDIFSITELDAINFVNLLVSDISQLNIAFLKWICISLGSTNEILSDAKTVAELLLQ